MAAATPEIKCLRYFSKEDYETEMEEQRRALEVLKQFDDFKEYKHLIIENENETYEEYMDKYKKYLEQK